MKCLIIAAGRGSRLQGFGPSKPLTPVCGVPLIERVIFNCSQAYIDHFVVVTGYKYEALTTFLRQLEKRAGITIEIIHNDDWQSENGLSVLAAQHSLSEPFLLQMADHLIEPALISRLSEYSLPSDAVALAVDVRKENPLVDLDDVTRVQIEGGLIRKIGKHLDVYNAYDTGLFLCNPVIFDAIQHSHSNSGDASLSGGMRFLIKSGRAYPFDSGSAFWLDVDTSQDHLNAEKSICHNMGAMSPAVNWERNND